MRFENWPPDCGPQGAAKDRHPLYKGSEDALGRGAGVSEGTRCTFGVLPWPAWRQRGSENRGAQCGCWGGDAGVGAGDALGPAPEAPPRGPAPEAPPPRPFVTAWRAEPAVFPGVPGPGARGRARDRAGAASCAPLLLPGAEASPRRAAEQLKPRRPPPASGNDKPRGSSRPRLRLRYLQPGALWTASRHSG